FRPRQRGSVRLCGVGGSQHERLGFLSLAGTELAQALDRAAERELRSAQALDEVAAPGEPERLERPQLGVDGAVAPREPLRTDAVARHDALPLEQELGERAPVRLA